MNPELEAPLRKAISFLESRGYKYAIIGGIALSQRDYARFTYDVDIKVLVPNTDYAAVRTAIRAAFPKRARQHRREDPLIVAVEIDDVIVDFLLALPGYEEQIIHRASLCDFGGWEAWVCSAEDLIVQKVAAGRSKDWVDIEELLTRQFDRLDHSYVLFWVSQIAEALEKPELLITYKRLVAGLEVLSRSGRRKQPKS